jgi:hypothetical protein
MVEKVFSRENNFCKNLVIVDGASGSGKSVISPLLSCFENVEKFKVDYKYENFCILNNKKNDFEDQIYLKTFADNDLYDSVIAREINTRFYDYTSIFQNNNWLNYLKRLFLKSDEKLIEYLINKKPYLNLQTHGILISGDILFRTFQERLKMIVVMRHPVYLVEHWMSYNIDRYGQDPKQFQMALKFGESNFRPWYAESIENYEELNYIEKIVSSIIEIYKKYFRKIETFGLVYSNQMMTIPFEDFVLYPDKYIKNISGLLGRNQKSIIHNFLKKHKCPRKNLLIGPTLGDYKNKKGDKKLYKNDIEEFNKKLEFIKKNINPRLLNEFKFMIDKYRNAFTFEREMPWEK